MHIYASSMGELVSMNIRGVSDGQLVSSQAPSVIPLMAASPRSVDPGRSVDYREHTQCKHHEMIG